MQEHDRATAQNQKHNNEDKRTAGQKYLCHMLTKIIHILYMTNWMYTYNINITGTQFQTQLINKFCYNIAKRYSKFLEALGSVMACLKKDTNL